MMEFYLRFENGMPQGTAQEKGERICYVIKNGKRVPYIKHYRKPSVDAARAEFIYKLKKYKPAEPLAGPIRLTVILSFDKKAPKKCWGTYKTTRPDCSNYVKELEDAMTECGFWFDDNQVADLRVVKYYAESATIYVRLEELQQ